MKKFIIVLSLAIGVGTVITLNSCKKEATPITADDSVSAQDNATVSNAINATSDDAVAAAGSAQGSQQKANILHNMPFFCGITISETGRAGDRIITITYDGTTNCRGIIRSGTITVYDTSGLQWKDAGAFIIVAYTNLKITDVKSGNSYIINGSHTITKETHGLEWQVMAGLVTNTTVTTRNIGGMSITFSDGSEGMWKVDRTRSWNSTLSGRRNVITAAVYTEDPGKVDLSGITRYGDPFDSYIESAIAANNNPNCIYEPYRGETRLVIGKRVTTVVYGTNPQGVQIGSPTTCGDGYYITYTNGVVTFHRFIGYF